MYRSSDIAGNIYETVDMTDRMYGAGSRLERSGVDTGELKSAARGGHGRLVTKGTEYAYDGEGNLIRKTGPDGAAWQYEDAETGLYYNRFRYYDPGMGQYTQQDPIGLAGGNPTLYAYVRDPNSWVDPWGLWTYYELIQNAKVIYHGITDRAIQTRLIEHARGYGNSLPKVFDQVRHIDVGGGQAGRVAARNLEGSALLHASDANVQLLNQQRPVSDGFYHQYNPNDLADGRTLLSQSEIDRTMQSSTTQNVDGRGNIQCP